jgi:hypothetical protein
MCSITGRRILKRRISKAAGGQRRWYQIGFLRREMIISKAAGGQRRWYKIGFLRREGRVVIGEDGLQCIHE